MSTPSQRHLKNYIDDIGFGLYLGLGAMAATVFLASFAIRRFRSPTKLTFYVVLMTQCTVRAFFFHIDQQYYVNEYEEHGIWIFLILDLTPEAFFMWTYVLLLASWIEINYAFRSKTPYSHLRSFVYFLVLSFLLLITVIFFVYGMKRSIPESMRSSYGYYQNYIVPAEANFITASASTILGLFIVVFFIIWKLIQGLSTHAARVSSLSRAIVFLALVCTFGMLAKAVYVQSLNNEEQKKYLNGDMTYAQYEWFWFSYFVVTEMTVHFAILCTFGIPLALFAIRRLFRGRSTRHGGPGVEIFGDSARLAGSISLSVASSHKHAKYRYRDPEPRSGDAGDMWSDKTQMLLDASDMPSASPYSIQ